MRISNNHILDQVDDFLNQKEDNEKKIIHMLLAGIIGFIIYQYIFTQTDILYEDINRKTTSLKKKISQVEGYIGGKTGRDLSNIKNDIKKRQEDYDSIVYNINYIDNTFSELSYLLFGNNTSVLFLDNISYLADKYNIKISEISNQFFNPVSKKISKILTVDLTTESSYHNMMKFLNSIEESQLVVDISDINITRPTANLHSKFKISVWGMKD
jgi:hypothetical protein